MADTLERQRSLVLTLLCLSTIVNYIDRQSLAVVLPELRHQLDLTGASYGNIATLFLIAYTIGQIGMGALIDRIGTRVGFIVSIVIWSIAAILHSVVSSARGFGVVRVILGIGESGNWPAGAKSVAEWFPKERRAFAMGVFDGGSAIGAVIAPPLMVWLTSRYGWRSAFGTMGLLGFAWLAAWIAIYRTPPRDLAAPAQPPRHRYAWSILRSRALWGLMLTRMLATRVWWFYVFWLPDYLSKGRGFSLQQIGYFAWIPFVTVDLGKIVGGGISDRLLRNHTVSLARKSVMAAAALCMMTGLFVVSAPNAAAAIGWVSLATFGFGMWSANILALHADVFSSEVMATAIGWTGTAASLGGAAFTWMIGQVVDLKGYAPVFAATALVAGLALISLVLLVGRVERQILPESVPA
jgi:ACS family hexuronate transporter-like MFS transporter